MALYTKVLAAVAAMGLATVVFAADTTTTTATKVTTETAVTTPVNVNTATAKDLMKVKGLTSAKSKAIVAYRKKNGNFTSLDQLKEVKGFKKMDDKTMKDIVSQLTLS